MQPDHRRVLAQETHARHRHVRCARPKRGHHPALALDELPAAVGDDDVDADVDDDAAEWLLELHADNVRTTAPQIPTR